MDETGRNPAKVRNLALGLLKLAETTENIFTDRQLTFLRSMVGQAEATLALSPSQRNEGQSPPVGGTTRNARFPANYPTSRSTS